MKKLNRLALLALVGGLLSSALVMGCGGGATEDPAAGTPGNATNGAGGTTNAASNTATP